MQVYNTMVIALVFTGGLRTEDFYPNQSMHADLFPLLIRKDL